MLTTLIRRPFVRWAAVAVSGGVLLTCVVLLGEFARDLRDSAAARPCALPVTEDRSCVYEVPAVVTSGKILEDRTSLQVKPDSGRSRSLTVRHQFRRLTTDKRVSVLMWDGQIVGFAWEDEAPEHFEPDTWSFAIALLGWAALAALMVALTSFLAGAAAWRTAAIIAAGTPLLLAGYSLKAWLFMIISAIAVAGLAAVVEVLLSRNHRAATARRSRRS